MSRLHAKVSSDRRKGATNIAADEVMGVEITWGGATAIKDVVQGTITWSKGWQRPLLVLNLSDDFDVMVYADGGPQYVRQQK